MEINISVAFKMEWNQEMEYTIIQMVMFIKANGNVIKKVELVKWKLDKIFIKDSGTMEKCRARENINLLLKMHLKDIGKMDFGMEGEFIFGIMEMYIRVVGKEIKWMEPQFLRIIMDKFKDGLKMMNYSKLFRSDSFY